MPTRIPTVTRLTVLTVTTRSPASNAGPASGRSTAQNRRHGEYPTATAERRTLSSTAANASAANRVIKATA